jgi:hypothetical protein
MPSKFPTLRVSPLRGLNLKDDKYNLKTGDLILATNVFGNNDGSIERVDGYADLFTELSATPSTALSIFEWKRYDGSRDIVFMYSGGLYMIQSYATSPAAQLLTSGLTSGKRTRYVHYNDYLFFGNGYDYNRVITPSPIHSLVGTGTTVTNASDLATVKDLYNDLRTKYTTHIADVVAHTKADSTNTITHAALVEGDSQAETNTAVNELKSEYSDHRSQSKVHLKNDSYRGIVASDASDLATSITLINDIKKAFNQHVAACRVIPWCITTPVTAPTTAAAAGAGLEDGTYMYCYTFYNKDDGVESAPSPIDTVVTSGGDDQVSITAMDVSTDPYVTHKRIYRTFVDGGTFYRVTEIDNKVTAYTDSTTDANLGTGIQTEDTGVVEITSIFCLHKDRIYLSGSVSDPYRVYYTEPVYPTLYKPAYNYQDFDVSVTGIASIPNGLFVFEKHKTWLWLNPPYGNAPVVLSSLVGCANAESIISIDGVIVFRDSSGNVAALDSPVIWQSEHGIFASNGQVPVCISEFINRDYVTRNLNSSVSVYDAINNRLYAIIASK